jgi:hypothetical protein
MKILRVLSNWAGLVELVRVSAWLTWVIKLLGLSSIAWLISRQCLCSELFDLSQHFWSAACFGWY